MTRKIVYKDVDLDFQKHPNTNDVSKLINVSAVKRSIRNLVFTAYYDAPWQPAKGNFIANALFENDEIFTKETIKSEILQLIDLWEPRVTDVGVEVESKENEFRVYISFKVIQLSEYVNFDVVLKILN